MFLDRPGATCLVVPVVTRTLPSVRKLRGLVRWQDTGIFHFPMINCPHFSMIQIIFFFFIGVKLKHIETWKNLLPNWKCVGHGFHIFFADKLDSQIRRTNNMTIWLINLLRSKNTKVFVWGSVQCPENCEALLKVNAWDEEIGPFVRKTLLKKKFWHRAAYVLHTLVLAGIFGTPYSFVL